MVYFTYHFNKQRIYFSYIQVKLTCKIVLYFCKYTISSTINAIFYCFTPAELIIFNYK